MKNRAVESLIRAQFNIPYDINVMVEFLYREQDSYVFRILWQDDDVLNEIDLTLPTITVNETKLGGIEEDDMSKYVDRQTATLKEDLIEVYQYTHPAWGETKLFLTGEDHLEQAKISLGDGGNPEELKCQVEKMTQEQFDELPEFKI